MTKALLKDTFREIKKSFGRFISILIIAMLGVAFFAGIRAAGPDMKLTADSYFDDTDMMDIRVVSNLGLVDKDIEGLSRLDGIESIMPAYSADMLMEDNSGATSVVRLHSVPNGPKLNKLVVKEGRLPEKSGECVVESGVFYELPSDIGDVIELKSGTDDDVSDTLLTDKFTVVGIVESPYYISYERGNCTIDDGSVDTFAYIPAEDFATDYYTDAFLTVNGAKEMNSLDDAYQDYIAGTTEEAETLGETRAAARREELLAEAGEKIADAEQELKDGEEEMNEKLADAEKDIEKGEADLKDAERQYEEGQKEFDEKIADGEKKIIDGENTLKKAEKQYTDGLAEYKTQKKLADKKFKETEKELEQAKQALDESKASLDEGKKEIDAGEAAIAQSEAQLVQLKQTIDGLTALIGSGTLTPAEQAAYETQKQALENQYHTAQAGIEAAKKKLEPGKTAYNAGLEQYNAGLAEYTAGLKKYETEKKKAEAALKKAKKELDDAKKQIDSGKEELEKSKSILAAAKKDGQKELDDAARKIEEGRSDLEQGKQDYSDAKREGEEKIADAKRKIEDAKEEVADIPEGEWYVTTRTDNLGVGEYKEAAERMAALADVFPLIFFIIAALVCLNTMTRMVDEERSYIGTLMGLGYRKGAIAGKYLIYGAVASVIGSAVGVVVGIRVFPFIITGAYSIMYTLPSPVYGFFPLTAVGSAVIAVGITLISCYAACRKALAGRPAALMRPKAPKAGKRILLERIGFIWSKMSFSVKVTMRNLFRYKKRFLMTVIGISGSMALLLAGFGLKDSITNIVAYQYGDEGLFDYDLMVVTDPDEGTIDERLVETVKISDAESGAALYTKTVDLTAGEEKEKTTIVVPYRTEGFENYIHMQNRVTGEKVYFGGADSAVLTEKAAAMLDVKPGDTVTVRDGDTERYDVTVTGITENYTSHYLYLSPELYEKLWGEEPDYDMIYVKLPEGADSAEASRLLLPEGFVIGVKSVEELVDSFSDTMKTLNYVVLVLIVSAGLLAFLILYNLTNMNVSERYREIASLKVLGFYDGEVLTYVYRENFILTGIGIVLGCFLGILLHTFLIATTEVNAVMFGRVIETASYIWSICLTAGFALLVNFVMYFKLKKIDMVEALKTVE